MRKLLHGKRWELSLAAISVLALTGLALAQAARPQPAGPRQQTAPGQSAPRESIDNYLADWVALASDNEVALAKVAQTRADDKDVVKFAEMMEKDHEQIARNLERFTGQGGVRGEPRGDKPADGARPRADAAGKAAANGAPRAERRDAPPQAQPAAPAGAVQQQPPPAAPGQVVPAPAQANAQHGSLGQTFLQIHRELADECLASAQRELHDKKGPEFDNCYIGIQLGAHMKLIDTLTVFEKHATPALQQELRKDRETAQKHFDQAKQIMKGLDGVHTARRDNK